MDLAQAHIYHKRAIVIDGHCDTVHLFQSNQETYSFAKNNTIGHIDLPRLQAGGVNIQLFALYIEEEYKPYGALRRTLTLLEHFWREMEKHGQSVSVIKDIQGLDLALVQGKLGALITLEGGEALEDIEILHVLYRMGLRGVGLTWNQRNMLADGVGVGHSASGLTPLGREMVVEMNKLGMLVDAAHLAPRGFYDLLEISASPVVVTHGNAAAICPHRRNLDDSQLQALKEQDGVIGLTFYPPFVSVNGQASLDDLLDHFCYIAEKFGTEVLALGADYDGITETVEGLHDVSCLPRITVGLMQRGFSTEEISNILGGNFLRVLRQVLK